MSVKIINNATKEIEQQIKKTLKINGVVPQIVENAEATIKTVQTKVQQNLLGSTFALVESTPGY